MDEIKLTNRERDLNVIKAAINLIPCVGGAISDLYFGAKEAVRIKRIESLYLEIAADVEKLKNFVPPDEFEKKAAIAGIIEEIHEAAERDITGEKIKYLKNCFMNIFFDNNIDLFDKRKYCITILSQLSDFDIICLTELYKYQDCAYSGKEIKENNELDEETKNKYFLSFAKLTSYSLLTSRLCGTLTPNVNWQEITSYAISPFGKDFVKFCLQDNSEKTTE